MEQRIQEITEQLLSHLSVPDFSVEVSELPGGVWNVAISTSSERALSDGENGRFEAFCHILKRMISKIAGEDVKSVVDVNGQRAKNE